MYRLLFVIIGCLICLNSSAQSISVKSFILLDTDLTANTAGTIEKDQNGETAALIKVVTTQTGFTFDGGALGIVKTVQKPSEIWVYVSRGLKKISISHPQLGMLRDYYLNIPIEAARTYEMILNIGEVQTIVKQARTSQYVVFQLTPSNAVVELDGKLLETTDGTASKMVKFGTYNYKVKAPNYLPEAGSVTIDDAYNKKVVSISLKPNFAQVHILVDNNAEIWVNGEKKAEGSWRGMLGVGTYELEAKKSGYRSTFITHDFIFSPELQEIRLEAPTPIFGEIDINSIPAMADVYIDNVKVGQSPLVIPELMIGNHNLKISKNGYVDYIKTINIEENKTIEITAELSNLLPVTITVQPSNASVRIDGVKYNDLQNLEFAPGTYNIMISAKGYDTIKTDLLVSSVLSNVNNYKLSKKEKPKKEKPNTINWEFVQLTTNQNDVSGKKYLGDVTEKYGSGGAFPGWVDSNRERCLIRIRKKAAKIGATIVLLGTEYDIHPLGTNFTKIPASAYR